MAQTRLLSDEVAVKASAGAVSEKLIRPGGSTFKMARFHDCQISANSRQVASVPHHIDLSIGLFDHPPDNDSWFSPD